MTALTLEQIANTKFLFLAGSGSDSIEVESQNKCFCKIKKRPILDYMLDVPRELKVKEIMIIGPENIIKKEIKDRSNISIIPEKEKLIDNLVYFIKNVKVGRREPVFVVFGDTPLWNKTSFLKLAQRMDFEKAGFYTSVIPKESLDLFSDYFKRNFMHFKQGLCRVGCLNGVIPNYIDVSAFQEIRQSRKLEKTLPKIKAVCGAIKYLGLNGVATLFNLYVAKAAYETKAFRTSKFFRKKNNIRKIEKKAAKMFKTPLKVLYHPFAEDGLDVDFKKDLDIFNENYNDLKKIINTEHQINVIVNNNKNIALSMIKYKDEKAFQKLIKNKKTGKQIINTLKNDYDKLKNVIKRYAFDDYEE